MSIIRPSPWAWPPALFGMVRRLPFVIEIQDLWPDSVAASDMAGVGPVSRLLTGICNFVYRRADRVVVQCAGMRQKLLERGVPDEKLVVVYNWTDEDAFAHPTPLDIPALAEPGRFNIVYAGNFGRAQSVDTIIRAVRIAQEEDPSIQLLLIGDGVEEDALRKLATEIGAANIIFHDRVTRGEVASIYPLADALVVTLTRQDLFAYVVPTKTQAYMAAGRPILMAVNGDAARLIEESGGGFAVPPEDPQALADGMLRLARMTASERDAIGAAGRDYYYRHLSFAKGMARTLEVIRRSGPPITLPAPWRCVRLYPGRYRGVTRCGWNGSWN